MIGLCIATALLGTACTPEADRAVFTAPSAVTSLTSSAGLNAGAVTGRATSAGSNLTGGSVEVFSTTGVRITDWPVTSAGYSGTLPDGSYQLVYQPPASHSMGLNESGQRRITVAGAAVQVANFIAQPALWYDDFQSYADSADLHANFATRTSNGTMTKNVHGAEFITLDPAAGPNGSRAMRYNIPGRPGDCTNASVAMLPAWKAAIEPKLDSFYIRWTTRESVGFQNGSAGCSGGRSYKFFLVQYGWTPRTNAGRMGTYLAYDDLGLFSDVNFAGAFRATSAGLGAASSWVGRWHTWIMRVSAPTQGQRTLEVFRDGVLLSTVTGPWAAEGDPRVLASMELGANINAGPDFNQQRWWRDVAVYSTKPTMIPLLGGASSAPPPPPRTQPRSSRDRLNP